MPLADIIIPALTTLAGAFGMNWLNKRKNKADAQKSEVDNVELALGIWKRTADHQEKVINNLQRHIERIEAKLTSIIRENEDTRKELYTVRKENLEFKAQLTQNK